MNTISVINNSNGIIDIQVDNYTPEPVSPRGQSISYEVQEKFSVDVAFTSPDKPEPTFLLNEGRQVHPVIENDGVKTCYYRFQIEQ